MLQEAVVDWPLLAQCRHRAFQLNRVPQRNGGHDQIRAAGAIALIFIGMTADLAQPVEEHGTRQAVSWSCPYVTGHATSSS